MDELNRHVYCMGPKEERPSEIVDALHKALRYTNQKFFEVLYNNTWVFDPQTSQLIEFCSPENMGN